MALGALVVAAALSAPIKDDADYRLRAMRRFGAQALVAAHDPLVPDPAPLELPPTLELMQTSGCPEGCSVGATFGVHGDPMFKQPGSPGKHIWLQAGQLTQLLSWRSPEAPHGRFLLWGRTMGNEDEGHSWFDRFAITHDAKPIFDVETTPDDAQMLVVVDGKPIPDAPTKGHASRHSSKRAGGQLTVTRLPERLSASHMGQHHVETLDIDVGGVRIELWSSLAEKYDDSEEQHKYMHLNLNIRSDLSTIREAHGVFAELAGIQTMSQATVAMTKRPVGLPPAKHKHKEGRRGASPRQVRLRQSFFSDSSHRFERSAECVCPPPSAPELPPTSSSPPPLSPPPPSPPPPGVPLSATMPPGGEGGAGYNGYGGAGGAGYNGYGGGQAGAGYNGYGGAGGGGATMPPGGATMPSGGATTPSQQGAGGAGYGGAGFQGGEGGGYLTGGGGGEGQSGGGFGGAGGGGGATPLPQPSTNSSDDDEPLMPRPADPNFNPCSHCRPPAPSPPPSPFPPAPSPPPPPFSPMQLQLFDATFGCRSYPYGRGCLRNGDAMLPGDCVHNKHAYNGTGGTLVLQEDGNMAIYRDDWDPDTATHSYLDGIDATHTSKAEAHGKLFGDGVALATFQHDGDLVLFKHACALTDSCPPGSDQRHHVQWSFSQRGPRHPGGLFAFSGAHAFLAEGSTCLPGMTCGGCRDLDTPVPAAVGCKNMPFGCGVMRNGDRLHAGDCIYNERAGTLALHENGNLVVYPPGWTPDHGVAGLDMTGTRDVAFAAFEADGDLALHRDESRRDVKWSFSRQGAARCASDAGCLFRGFLEAGSFCHPDHHCANGMTFCPGGRLVPSRKEHSIGLRASAATAAIQQQQGSSGVDGEQQSVPTAQNSVEPGPTSAHLDSRPTKNILNGEPRGASDQAHDVTAAPGTVREEIISDAGWAAIKELASAMKSTNTSKDSRFEKHVARALKQARTDQQADVVAEEVTRARVLLHPAETARR